MKDSIFSIFCSKKILLEVIPGFVFLLAYFITGLMFSVACLILASIVCSGIAYRDSKRIPVLPLVTIFLITVLSLLSLIFTDPGFIKIRATLSYCLFAGILLASLLRNDPLIKEVLDGQVEMSRPGWVKTTIAWSALNVLFALLNEVIWRTQSTGTWVLFDSIALPVLILLYIAVTRFFAERYWLESEAI